MIKETDLTDRQKLLRESNKIHDKLTALWFNASVMASLPKYSMKQINRTLKEIKSLQDMQIVIMRKRAELLISRFTRP